MIRVRFLFTIIMAWGWIACGVGPGSRPASPPPTTSMPPVETRDLRNTPLTIPAVGKVSVLVFISPHCSSCKELVADIDRYRRRFDPNRLAVIGIVLDADREAAVNLKSKEKVGFPWTVRNAREMAASYRVQGVPSVFLFDDRGDLSMTADGAPGDAARILRRAHALLEE